MIDPRPDDDVEFICPDTDDKVIGVCTGVGPREIAVLVAKPGEATRTYHVKREAILAVRPYRG